jgi:hypothetical protein
LEPFKTALELASRHGKVASRQVAKALRDRGVKWDFRPEVNQAMVDAESYVGAETVPEL